MNTTKFENNTMTIEDAKNYLYNALNEEVNSILTEGKDHWLFNIFSDSQEYVDGKLVIHEDFVRTNILNTFENSDGVYTDEVELIRKYVHESEEWQKMYNEFLDEFGNTMRNAIYTIYPDAEIENDSYGGHRISLKRTVIGINK